MELYKNDIIAAIKTKGLLLSNADINSTFFLYKKEWRLPEATTVNDFLDFLIKQKKIIKVIHLKSEKRSIIRYHLKTIIISPQELAIALYPNIYLSHYSAATIHDLTDEIVKSIYVNKEQLEKKEGRVSELIQKNIDEAFSKPMRQTNQYFDYNEQRIYVLNGKFANYLGVIEHNGIRVTNLERTLIDITVRPEYCGGVREVLNIYERAKGDVSVNKIKAYLQKLNYLYPYHQAIGFYLERAGYKDSVLKLIETIPIKYNFYLTYNIQKKEYSDRWHLYVPENL
ncbi:MAG: hypothetical protein WDZ91_08860 [Paenibacillaceae bacterium]